MTARRERILSRVANALKNRKGIEHPGGFPGPGGEGNHNPVELFLARFTEAGGEAVRLPSIPDAREWLASFSAEFGSAAVGALVPAELAPRLPEAGPESAELGVSMARGAAAFTGSLLLDARGGRRAQLLPPSHLIWVREETITATLEGLLAGAMRLETSALALHSGPSKSADIGRHLVKGVHGPGRVVAAVLAPG